MLSVTGSTRLVNRERGKIHGLGSGGWEISKHLLSIRFGGRFGYGLLNQVAGPIGSQSLAPVASFGMYTNVVSPPTMGDLMPGTCVDMVSVTFSRFSSGSNTISSRWKACIPAPIDAEAIIIHATTVKRATAARCVMVIPDL